jgi:hydroxycarboxylate dehydrogenase B
MGSVVPDQTVELFVDTPSLAVVDGKFGYGQTVAPQAVKIGIEKCKAAGLSAVALRNAGHIGRVGDWAEMAAAEGLVSVHFVNAAGSVLVAPYGASSVGCRRRPIASAFRARGSGRSCWISRPRLSPKARCWSRAEAARNCRKVR